MRRVGYVSGVHGACLKQTAVSFARLKYGAPAQEEWISVLGTPSMTARRQPQAHSACPRGGERAGAASTLPWLRSLRRPSQCATDSFVGWREDGDYTSIGCWGWGSKGGSGYEQLSVSLSQLPQGLLDFLHRLHAVFYWLGIRESSGVEAIHTWTGDALGRGPYQAVTALNSLR